MNGSPFSKSAVVLILATALGLFALSVLLHAYDNSPTSQRNKSMPGSYSVSAIGHAGVYGMLENLGYPVRRSTGNTQALVGRNGSLVLAEPDFNYIDSEYELMLMQVPRLLLVLPKWRGTPDDKNPAWISEAAPIWLNASQAALNLVSKNSEIARISWDDVFTVRAAESGHDFLSRRSAERAAAVRRATRQEAGAAEETGAEQAQPGAGTRPDSPSPGASAPTLPEEPQPAQKWAVNLIGLEPDMSGVVQLIRSKDLKPVVGNDNGMLVGELVDDGQVVWVLADPDVISNHGLHRGDNAAFTARLFELFTDRGEHNGGNLVFDETSHGYIQASGTPIKLLFRFPFVVVTWLVCASAALLVLAGTRRFGVPRPPRRELDYGKAQLIENSARLLDYAGYHSQVLKRYVRMTVNATALTLHAPQNLRGAALVGWLDRIGEARGLERSCSQILQTLNNIETDNASDGNTASISRLFECAGEIHRWKGEILNGSSASRHPD